MSRLVSTSKGAHKSVKGRVARILLLILLCFGLAVLLVLSFAAFKARESAQMGNPIPVSAK